MYVVVMILIFPGLSSLSRPASEPEATLSVSNFVLYHYMAPGLREYLEREYWDRLEWYPSAMSIDDAGPLRLVPRQPGGLSSSETISIPLRCVLIFPSVPLFAPSNGLRDFSPSQRRCQKARWDLEFLGMSSLLPSNLAAAISPS